jgi:hypothetical protein
MLKLRRLQSTLLRLWRAAPLIDHNLVETLNQPPPVPTPPRRRVNWLLFCILLLAPAVITTLAALSGNQDIPVACSLVGGLLGGIGSAVTLGLALGQTPGARVACSIAFAVPMVFVCIGLAFAGCVASGYNFRIQ